MTIQIDSREKARAIQKIIFHFSRNDVQYFVSKLLVGDYMNLDNPRVIIDRKQNLLELCSNVCQGHERFVNELKRAGQAGIQLLFLCEHGGGIKALEDVRQWENPRLKTSPLAVSGPRLFRILSTLEATYGTKFLFCSKAETGEKILELLRTEGR